MRLLLTLFTLSYLAIGSLSTIANAAANGVQGLFVSSDNVLAFNNRKLTNAQNQSTQSLIVKNRKQAIAMVKGRYQAKLLSMSSSKVNGNPGYRAKLLADKGTVFYVLIDAKTGRMKKS